MPSIKIGGQVCATEDRIPTLKNREWGTRNREKKGGDKLRPYKQVASTLSSGKWHPALPARQSENPRREAGVLATRPE